MKLELKHLAPYLPYKFYGIANFLPDEIFFIAGINETSIKGRTKNGNNVPIGCSFKEFKPILRPMSDFHSFMIEFLKEISIIDLSECEFEVGEYPEYYVNAIDKRGVCIDWVDFDKNNWGSSNYKNDGQKIVDPIEQSIILFKYHFDVFGLIDAGLAIDINTVPELLNG